MILLILLLWASVIEEASSNPRSQKKTEKGQGHGSNIPQEPKFFSIGSIL